jgi:myxalamid-type nonribosomal peptide synthetase MxaA
LNTLIIRSDFSDRPTCLEAVGRTSRRVLEALDHQDLPTDQIVEVVKPERVPGRHPLFQTMFIFQNEDERGARPDLDGCTVTPIHVETKTARFDISLFVAESGGALETILEYRADLFREDTARRFLDHYAVLMGQMVAHPEARISELAFLTAEERQFCARHEKGPALRIRGDVMVLDLIGRHVSETTMAIVSSRRSLTYRQLHELSDRLAARLKERGAGANRPIAIAMERSPDAIIAMLGILKAGAPYLAVDAANPEARIREVLADASVGLVISSRASEAWNGFDAVETIWLEETLEGDAERGADGASDVRPEQLAYLIYTSGTSGRPKGVPVTHKNLLASTLARLDYYGSGPGSFLLLSSLSFDSSVAGVFWALCTGDTLNVPSAEEARDPDAVCALVARHGIRALLAVPSLYEQVLEWRPEGLDTLRVAIVAGEPCPPRLVRKHRRILPKCELYNEYGPTEATVWASVERCDRGDDWTGEVSIGRPIPGCEIRILDSRRRRVPIGFVGELCIGGSGVTGGYIRRDELTATRFFKAEDGTPMYATGDLARWLPDGRLKYHGRNDEQVKLRGYRIEVGEIETRLREMPGIRDAVVLVTSTHSAEESGAPDLEELLSVLPEETVKRALVELDNATIEGNGSDAATVHRKADCEDFEVSLTLKRPGFIDPPRKAQRDWLLGQALNEVTADLKHLNAVAQRFVPGTDHKLGHDLIDLTDAALSKDQIMEEWQRPLMAAMARYAAEPGG